MIMSFLQVTLLNEILTEDQLVSFIEGDRVIGKI